MLKDFTMFENTVFIQNNTSPIIENYLAGLCVKVPITYVLGEVRTTIINYVLLFPLYARGRGPYYADITTEKSALLSGGLPHC